MSPEIRDTAFVQVDQDGHGNRGLVTTGASPAALRAQIDRRNAQWRRNPNSRSGPCTIVQKRTDEIIPRPTERRGR